MILVIITSNGLQASRRAQSSNCRDCVAEFYKILYTSNNYGTNGIREIDNKSDLCDHLSLEKVNEIVQKAPVSCDGWWMDSIVEIKLSDKQIIYFQVSLISPMTVNNVWLSDGLLLSDGSEGKIYFLRPGIINDSDGYTNIRKQPNAKSKIVRRILKNELFFFTPTSKSDWYRVYCNQLSPCIGYIHKSKITVYDDFPESIKRKVRKMRYPKSKYNEL
jgi:hypothetical protein